jgi:hypothetical protein
MLRHTGVDEEKVLILYSDAAAHILKDVTTLKVFYPNLIHLLAWLMDCNVLPRRLEPSFPK